MLFEEDFLGDHLRNLLRASVRHSLRDSLKDSLRELLRVSPKDSTKFPTRKDRAALNDFLENVGEDILRYPERPSKGFSKRRSGRFPERIL